MSIPLATIQRQPTPPPPMPVIQAAYFENPPPVPVWEESKPSIDLSSRKVDVIQERPTPSKEEPSTPPQAETPRETPASIFELADATPQTIPVANPASQQTPVDVEVGMNHSERKKPYFKCRRMKQICILTCLISCAVILAVGTITAGVCLIVFEKDNRKLRNFGISLVIIPPVVACAGIKGCLK